MTVYEDLIKDLMSQSLSRILIHVIFSTKDRKPILRPILPKLYPVIATLLTDENCPAITVGGWDDHIHILCSLGRDKSVAKLLQHIKVFSCKWIKQSSQEFHDFSWQIGYGAFSVSQSEQCRVKKYIDNQEEHHQRQSFQEELIEFLDKHEVTYDTKYLWT